MSFRPFLLFILLHQCLKCLFYYPINRTSRQHDERTKPDCIAHQCYHFSTSLKKDPRFIRFMKNLRKKHPWRHCQNQAFNTRKELLDRQLCENAIAINFIATIMDYGNHLWNTWRTIKRAVILSKSLKLWTNWGAQDRWSLQRMWKF